MNQNIVWLDPALETSNAGDVIISESIEMLALPALQSARRLTTHRRLRRDEIHLLRQAELVVVGGTNILHSHQLLNRQWPLSPAQIIAMKGKTVFLGVGWWQYQRPADWSTRRLLRYISHPSIPHALRDQYSADRITGMKLLNHMTSCPTLWDLAGTVGRVSPDRSKTVVTTLTDYHHDRALDTIWLTELARHYGSVLIVGMGPGDAPTYASMPKVEGTSWFGYGTKGLTEARAIADDYIGTRLHAGVRWLQLGGNTQIIAVDNRAAEIGADTGLPVLARTDIASLKTMLEAPPRYHISLPSQNIQDWRGMWERSVEAV